MTSILEEPVNVSFSSVPKVLIYEELLASERYPEGGIIFLSQHPYPKSNSLGRFCPKNRTHQEK